MDCFKSDGIDNQEVIGRMVESYDAFFDAYESLSEPIRMWFDQAFAHGRLPMSVMVVHIGAAVDVFADFMGVEV